MSNADKLSQLFVIIQIAFNTNKEEKEIKYFKLYEDIIKVLTREGIIRNYKINKNLITIFFSNIEEKIKIERISKSSRRIYTTYKKMNETFTNLYNNINKDKE